MIGLLKGEHKKGYIFAGSHAKPSVFLGWFQLQSRVVPNDGNWKEIDHAMFNVASAYHVTGHVIKFSSDQFGGERPIISKKY